MITSFQEEAVFGGPDVTKQKRLIHFSSGEVMVEDEEDEQQALRGYNGDHANKLSKASSFKRMALLVGRMSLLTCDFVGERLTGALGLTAAKYQYAIDQHDREQQAKRFDRSYSSEAEEEKIHLSLMGNRRHYGAIEERPCSMELQEVCDRELMPSASVNGGYQCDENYFE
ncbi:protein FAM177B [Synchiropus splendidus]|uniref:protein FAM177B n=1 Tax=Synchiropus splendidus TaxID=270530 RepID=UPI00237DD670|nr:protein FAM177B [Synchiropus splendidus]